MKKRRTVIAAVLLICLLVILGLLIRRTPAPPTPTEQDTAQAVASTPLPGRTDTAQGEEAPYANPVDFESLQSANPDICGWLYIPGTEINYPVVQRAGDDSFYVRRNTQGEDDQAGSLFTESAYNSNDFTDPVTVVYGHHMRSGTMFGKLQGYYSGEGGLDQYKDILVYLPDGVQCYTVFAAVPYSNKHVLYYNDFQQPKIYQKFLDEICSIRAVGANVDTKAEVTPEDQLLILSTCLNGNNKKRYLVLAKRTDDRTTTQAIAQDG